MRVKEFKFKDEKGNEITGIRGFSAYKDGFVILTDTALYSNIKLKDYDENNPSSSTEKNTIPRGKISRTDSGNSEKTI